MKLANLEVELRELKRAIEELSKKVNRLEKVVFSQRSQKFDRTLEWQMIASNDPRIKPLFVKGHDMPRVVTTPREPIRGRFLTLKILYDKDKSLLVEDICKETKRSRSLETSYLNNLAKDGLIEKERDYIDGRERMRYRITEVGKKVMENLLT